MKKLNVFQKKIKLDKQEFIAYSTKNKKGEFCKVSFCDDAYDQVRDNIENMKPFTINVENNMLSYKEKVATDKNGNAIVNKEGEPIINRTFYINLIDSFEPYVQPDIDDDII